MQIDRDEGTAKLTEEPVPQVVNAPLEPEEVPEDIGTADGSILYNLHLDDRTPTPSLRTVQSRTRVYHKMMSNSTIFGILLAFKSLCLTAKHDINESPDDPDRERAKKRAEFLRSCINDMQTPFTDVISEILEMTPMGFQVMVPQFKVRTGYDADPQLNSLYRDGKIGWKSWLPIDPRTILEWHSPEGQGYLGLTGITQRVNYNAREVHIPRNRLHIFRTTASGNDPTGKSILAGAVLDWMDLVSANEIQMVGLKRSLEGVAYGRIHSKLVQQAKTKSSDGSAARSAIAATKKAVVDFDARKDRGFILPADTDENGKLLADVRMMGGNEGGGNSKIQDSKIIIDSKEQSIARSMLAQFMTISNKGGSYALSKNNTEVFINSLIGYMDQIAGVINNEAIPSLFRANGEALGKDDHYLPRLVFSDFIKEDVTEFMGALEKAIKNGILAVTPQIQKKAAKVLKVDDSGQEELLKERQREERELRDALKKQREANGEDIQDASQDDVAGAVVGGDEPEDTTQDEISDPILGSILSGED